MKTLDTLAPVLLVGDVALLAFDLHSTSLVWAVSCILVGIVVARRRRSKPETARRRALVAATACGDIDRSAELLLRRYGALGAKIHAARRAGDFMAAGDRESQWRWLRILDALRRIADKEPQGSCN